MKVTCNALRVRNAAALTMLGFGFLAVIPVDKLFMYFTANRFRTELIYPSNNTTISEPIFAVRYVAAGAEITSITAMMVLGICSGSIALVYFVWLLRDILENKQKYKSDDGGKQASMVSFILGLVASMLALACGVVVILEDYYSASTVGTPMLPTIADCKGNHTNCDAQLPTYGSGDTAVGYSIMGWTCQAKSLFEPGRGSEDVSRICRLSIIARWMILPIFIAAVLFAIAGRYPASFNVETRQEWEMVPTENPDEDRREAYRAKTASKISRD